MTQLVQAPPAKAERIELADWRDIQRVLRDSHEIWSSGLSKSAYYEYIWWQMHHTWSRKNYRYFVYKSGADEIVSSCKLYTFEATSRHQRFKVGGIGAVFTPERHRGHGYAGKLLNLITRICTREGYDALLLYSDIGLDFYERLGYEPLGSYDFYLWMPGCEAEGAQPISQLPNFDCVKNDRYDVISADLSLVPHMVRMHRRWRDGLPFAIDRTEDYWRYKLARERYVAERSSRKFAPIELLTVNKMDGYALLERTAKIMRVLEVVGSEEQKERLWLHLMRLAASCGIDVIRGWESSAPLFLRGVRYVERDYSMPMVLPINPAVAKWQDPLPCPLLELDHF